MEIEKEVQNEITNNIFPLPLVYVQKEFYKGKTVLLIEKELTNIPAGEYQIQMTITFLDGNRYTFYPPNPATQASFHIIPAILF